MHKLELGIGVSQLRVRPSRMPVESQIEHTLRLAHVNGLTQPRWLLRPNQRAVPLQLCPLCLAERKLWSKEWRESPVAICSCHWIWLVDVCAGCGDSLAWPRTRLMQCHCGADLTQIPVQPVAQSLRSCLDLQNNISIEVLRWLGAWSIHGPRGKPLKKANCKSLIRQQALLTQGAETAMAWPHSFEMALSQHRRSSQPHDLQRFNQAWPGLRVQISRLADASWREKIWSAINRVVEDSHQSASPIVGRNPRLQMRPKTQREVANALGVGIARLQATISDIAAPVPNSQSRTGRMRYVISKEAVQTLQYSLVEWISIRESAILLGCGRVRAASMVKDSLIESRAGKLSRSSVESIRDRLLAMAKSLQIETPTDSLEHVWRYLVPKEMSKKFLEAIFQGRIRIYGPPEIQDWHGIKVHRSDIEASAIAERSSSKPNFSINEAAFSLQIKEQGAYDLVKRGFLKTVDGNGSGRRVTQEAIVKFSEQYIALSNLTRRKGVHSRDALNWAVAQGLNVVTGPRIDGSRQYFIGRQN